MTCDSIDCSSLHVTTVTAFNSGVYCALLRGISKLEGKLLHPESAVSRGEAMKRVLAGELVCLTSSFIMAVMVELRAAIVWV